MIVVLELFEVLLIFLTLYVAVTQLAIPIVRHTPLWPMFRKEAKLQKAVKEARQEVVEDNLEKELKDTRDSVKNK